MQMSTFETEHEPFQGRNFRNHLNRNWLAGNYDISQLNNRFSNVLNGSTKDSEVIDSRSSDEGVYPTLGDRLNAMSQSDKYYLGVTTQRYYDENLNETYYITKIPHSDRNGNRIKIQKGIPFESYNEKDLQTALDYMEDYHPNATLVMNAAPWYDDANGNNPHEPGTIIQNGKIISTSTETIVSDQYILAVMEDGTLTYYPESAHPNDMISDGVVDTYTGFFPLIVNSKPFSSESIFDGYGKSNRQIIAQLDNKDIIILTADYDDRNDVFGGNRNSGLNLNDAIKILLNLGAVFAYNLDGGGSTTLINKGITVNEPHDENGQEYRKVASFMYVEKAGDTSKALEPEKAFTVQRGNIAYTILRNHILRSDNSLFVNVLDKVTLQTLGDWRSPSGSQLGMVVENDTVHFEGIIANKSSYLIAGGSNTNEVSQFGKNYPLFTLPSNLKGFLGKDCAIHIFYPVACPIFGGAGKSGDIVKLIEDTDTGNVYLYETSDKVGGLGISINFSVRLYM